MRAWIWTLATTIGLAGASSAQPPAPSPAPVAPADAGKRLDELLTQWEQRMKGLNALVAVLKRTEIDNVAKTKEEYRGQLKFLRPDRADLTMQKTTNPQVYERFLSTGNFLFQFDPKQKVIRAYPLPQRAPGQPAMDNSFVGFLAGMSAAEARRRFDLTLLKEDQWYAYIEVKPRLADDKAEFSLARLALLKSTMMPAEMQFVPPNNSVIIWTIEKIDTNAAVAAADFAAPQLKQMPPGWQMQQMPPPGAPTNNIPPTKVRPVGK